MHGFPHRTAAQQEVAPLPGAFSARVQPPVRIFSQFSNACGSPGAELHEDPHTARG